MSEEMLEPVETETPEVDPAIIAQFLGVDVDYLDTVKKNAKNSEVLLKKAQQEKSMTAREREELSKQILEAAKLRDAAQPKDENLPQLDEQSRRLLDMYVEEKLEPLRKAQEAQRDAEIKAVITAFEEAHPEADLDAISGFLDENDIAPQSATALKRAMNLAHKNLYDNPEKRIREELEKKMGKDGEVVEIRSKSKSAPPEAQKDLWKRNDLTIKEIGALLRGNQQ